MNISSSPELSWEEEQATRRAKEAAELEKERRCRGLTIAHRVDYPPDPLDSTTVKCLAVTTCGGVLVVRENGDVYGDGITPPSLYRYLKAQHFKHIAYIFTGPNESWFVQKTNGKYMSEGLPRCVWEDIEDEHSPVNMVVLGMDGVAIVKYGNGKVTTWNSHYLPQRLQTILKFETCHSVWLSPEDPDGYFVSFGDADAPKTSFRKVPNCIGRYLTDGALSVRSLVTGVGPKCYALRYNFRR